MADIPVLIKERELRFFHCWMHRESGDLKKMIARDCVLLFGTDPLEFLDRPSYLEAIEKDFRLLGIRMGDGVARRYGKTAYYSAPADLELKIGARDWKGRFLITGLWRKFRFGGWKLVERTISPLAEDNRLPESIQRLQMWQG